MKDTMSFVNSFFFMLVVSFVAKASRSDKKGGMKLGDFHRELLQAEENSTDYFTSTSDHFTSTLTDQAPPATSDFSTTTASFKTSNGLVWVCTEDCDDNCDDCDGDCDTVTCNTGCDDFCDSGCTSCCDDNGYNCDCSCNYNCDSSCDDSCTYTSCDEDCDGSCDEGCDEGCAYVDISSPTIYDTDPGGPYSHTNARFNVNWNINVAGLVLLSIMLFWMW